MPRAKPPRPLRHVHRTADFVNSRDILTAKSAKTPNAPSSDLFSPFASFAVKQSEFHS